MLMRQSIPENGEPHEFGLEHPSGEPEAISIPNYTSLL